jgi:hypothetical protein
MHLAQALRFLGIAAVLITWRGPASGASPRATRSSPDDFNARAAKVFSREYLEPSPEE